MNRVILMGRLTKDPEIRYSQGTPVMAVARYTLAVKRRYKQKDAPDVDFLNCVAFGKTAEFAEKYFRQGQMVAVVGRIQNRNWTDNEGRKHYATDIIVDEQYFAENKKNAENAKPSSAANQERLDGFYPVNEIDDELPW